MEKTLLCQPSFYVHVRTGEEGPRHDPYSFEEFTVQRGCHDVTLHRGLADWIEIDGVRTKEEPEKLFWQVFGFTPEQLRRWCDRANSRCKSCGCRHFEYVSGFPGETLYICRNCKDVVGSEFSESAVL